MSLCYTKLNIDQFLDSTEVLPILRVLEWCFQLGVRQFYTNFGLNCLFVIILVPIISLGKIILTGWAILSNGQVEFTG